VLPPAERRHVDIGRRGGCQAGLGLAVTRRALSGKKEPAPLWDAG